MNAPDHSHSPVPAPIRAGNLIMRFDRRPYIMGILNVTPDSFSDGGAFFDAEAAVDHALAMVEEGVDILDVGGESTRPGSDLVGAEEEAGRVVPVIEKICRWTTVPVSIDTTKSQVARAAIEAGASMVNDVSSLRFDSGMGDFVAKAGVPLVVMHMRGEPKTMQAGPIVYDDLLGEIVSFLDEALQRAVRSGINREQIIIDPGIGFGKTPEHNLVILNRLGELMHLGRPVMVGASRKAFLGKILDVEVTERLFGTAGAVAAAAYQGAHIVRVHDVAAMREVTQVVSAIRSERIPDAGLTGEQA
jgi:dihydropteroate synthase